MTYKNIAMSLVLWGKQILQKYSLSPKLTPLTSEKHIFLLLWDANCLFSEFSIKYLNLVKNIYSFLSLKKNNVASLILLYYFMNEALLHWPRAFEKNY